MTRPSATEAGFTLIELAIVLIAIGLIIGGVIKGQDLIASARLNSVQVQANELRTATRTFYKKWDGWPGDISAADAARIASGLGGLAAGTVGDGVVNGNRIDASTASEATWFWHHLRAAGLVAGIPVVANGTLSATQALTSRMGGVWTFDWADTNLLSANPTFGVPDVDHWFALGATASAPNFGPILTPSQMRSIDLKSDDGMPNTGSVVGGHPTSQSCKAGANVADSYSTGTAIACFAWFRL